MRILERLNRRASDLRPWLGVIWRTSWRHRRDALLALLLVAIYLVAAGRYSRATPPFEGAEEPWQLAYAMRLVDSPQEFGPIESRVDVAPSWRPGEQSPLYGALSRWIVAGLDPAGEWYVPNPFALPWTREPASLNAVLHGSPAYAPPPEVAIAVTRLRRLSAAAGVATIVLCYALGRLLLPTAKWRPFLATALVGLNPFFLGASVQANAHALLVTWTTLALFSSLVISRGWHTPVAALTLGVVCGLAALTSPLGLAAVVLIPLAWHSGASRSVDRRMQLNRPLLSFGVLAVCAGWWYLAWLFSPSPAMERLPFSLETLVESYLQAWGSFGWLVIRAEPAYLGWVGVATVFTLLLVLVGMANAAWQGRGPAVWRRWRLPLCWAIVASLTATLVTVTSASRAPFAWLLAIPALVLLAVGDVHAQLPNFWRQTAFLLVVIPIGVTAWAAPEAYIAPAFTPPPRITLSDVPQDIRDVAIAFDDGLYLLGYHAPWEVDAQTGSLDITLYWLCADQPEHDYVHSLSVVDHEGEVLGRIEALPTGGTYPTSLWQPAEVIVERYQLGIEPTASQPVAASLRMAVRRLTDGVAAIAVDSHGNELGSSASIGRIRVSPETTASREPQHTRNVRFGDWATLVGYDAHPFEPTAGQPWTVTLHWHVDHHILGDWTVFVHLVDDAGNLIAQGDSQPLGGALPTQFWRPGDHLSDAHRLLVPLDLPDEPLFVHVGFYQLETGERLASAEPGSPDAPANYAEIGPFRGLTEAATP